jgi:hypothetical protein
MRFLPADYMSLPDVASFPYCAGFPVLYGESLKGQDVGRG